MAEENYDQLFKNLVELDTANDLLTQVLSETGEGVTFTDSEKQEIFSFVREKLNAVKSQIDGFTPEQARDFEQRVQKEEVDALVQASFDNLKQIDEGYFSTYMASAAAFFGSLWSGLKAKYNALVGGNEQQPSPPSPPSPPSEPQGPSYSMMEPPQPPPMAGSPSRNSEDNVPEPTAGRNYGGPSRPSRPPQGPRPSASQKEISRATRPASPAGGPEYFVRNGFNRYSPAVEADIESGQQLFMKNPNPALRAVYPYVKVDSMIKKARRATPA